MSLDTINEVINEISLDDCRILEMVQDNSLVNVPVDNRIDISTITADDPDPKFVNVEVIRAGISKTNRRRYNNNVVREINDLIPGLQGYLGHPDPSKYGFEFREPQCIFVGSLLEQMQDGVHRTIAKAYLFKSSPLREWIPKSIAANNPMTVSINGAADIVRNSDIIDVIHMTNLQSVDWANPGTEGMGTSTAISVVREQQNNNNLGGSEMSDAKDIIKNTTVTEFKAYNQDGYNAILQSVTVQELQSINPKLLDQIKESSQIVEMQMVIGGEKKSVKIAEMQSIITELEGKVSTLSSDIDTMKITEFKTKKINELVPETYREKISGRVTGKTEEEITSSINAEIAYIREMGGLTNVPAGTNRQTAPDDMKTAVKNLFGVNTEKK